MVSRVVQRPLADEGQRGVHGPMIAKPVFDPQVHAADVGRQEFVEVNARAADQAFGVRGLESDGDLAMPGGKFIARVRPSMMMPTARPRRCGGLIATAVNAATPK